MAAAAACRMLVVMAIILVVGRVSADPEPLQDICVADLNSTVKVNGFPCKSNTSANDFYSALLANPGSTNNTFGSLVTGANVQRIPGLNTLGVSLSRIDYAPGGLNPPHTHPRATEIVFVLYGELEVGFLTTANVLYTKTIKHGEIFVFPRGLVHFQFNNGTVPASVIAGFNSQLPGTQTVSSTLFGSWPPVPDTILSKAFRIEIPDVQKIKERFVHKW